MNKKPIGSRQAEKMARGAFGEKTFVARSGKCFQVRIKSMALGGVELSFLKGKGKSWEAALIDAGISIPDSMDAMYPVVTPEGGAE